MRAWHVHGSPSREVNTIGEQNGILLGLCCPSRRTNRSSFVCLLPNKHFWSAICWVSPCNNSAGGRIPEVRGAPAGARGAPCGAWGYRVESGHRQYGGGVLPRLQPLPTADAACRAAEPRSRANGVARRDAPTVSAMARRRLRASARRPDGSHTAAPVTASVRRGANVEWI